MKSKMRKKLIAFMLCMVLVICNSVSILADAPAAATTTTEKQVKETGTAKSEGESEEEKSADDEKDTSEQFDEESAPETETTEKKEETTEATTEDKEDATTATTTKAKEETTEATETSDKDETTGAEDDSDKKDETSETSEEETDKEKTTEAKDETAPSELTYTNEDVVITVSEVAEGAIPEGAELKVVPIQKDDADTQTQYAEVEQKIQEKAAETETAIAGFLAYDITFVDKDGNEIEPNSEVKVSMEYKNSAMPAGTEENISDANITVMHLEENADGQVKDVVDMSENNQLKQVDTTEKNAVQKTEFVTKSFSVFTITWTYKDESNLKIQAHYGYMEGDNFVEFDESKNYAGKNESLEIDWGSWNPDDSIALQTYAGRLGEVTEDYWLTNIRILNATGTEANYLKVTRDRVGGTLWNPNYVYKLQSSINGYNDYNDVDGFTNMTGDQTIKVYYIFNLNPPGVTVNGHYGYLDGDNFVEFTTTEGGSTTKELLTLRFDKYSDSDTDLYKYQNEWSSITNEEYRFLGTSLKTAKGQDAQYIKLNRSGNNYNRKYSIQSSVDSNTFSDLEGYTNMSSGESKTLDVYYVFEEVDSSGSGGQGGDVEFPQELTKYKRAERNEDGTYDLSLRISGSTGTITNKTKIDVVLVLDVSGSMKETKKGSSNTKIEQAATAVGTLINSLDTKETVDARYNVVTFGTTANLLTGWAWNGQDVISEVSAKAEDMLRDDDYNQGTNYEAGLITAQSQLDRARSNARQVVVFLTDGEPTYHVTDEDGSAGRGNGTSIDTLNHAQNAASNIKASSFYVIGTDMDQSITIYESNNRYNDDKYSGKDSVGNTISARDGMLTQTLLASLCKASEITDSHVYNTQNDLSNIFGEIADQVTTIACKNVTVTDRLSQYAEPIEDNPTLWIKLYGKGENGQFDFSSPLEKVEGLNPTLDYVNPDTGNVQDVKATYTDGTITLDFPDNYELNPDYTYEVGMKIQPTDAAYTTYQNNNNSYPTGIRGESDTGTHSGEQGFYSNESATVTYDYTEGNESPEPEDFPKPVIQISEDKLEKTEIVNFYLNLSSRILDTEGNFGSQEKEFFTTSVSGSKTAENSDIGIGVPLNEDLKMKVPKGHQCVTGDDPDNVITGTSDVSAKDVDEIIRQLGTADGQNGTVGDHINETYQIVDKDGNPAFPTDAEIFQYIRDHWTTSAEQNSGKKGVNKGQDITVNDIPIDKENLTTENFAIRWYVLKEEVTDQWHIDGVLVPKSGILNVTKTFSNQDIANQLSETFSVTVTGNFLDTTNTTVRLPLNEAEATTNLDGSVTYAWPSLAVFGGQYTIVENGYGNEELTKWEYVDTDYVYTNALNANQEGKGISVIIDTDKTEADSDPKIQSFAFTNNYQLKTTDLDLIKTSKNSNDPISGAVFKLSKKVENGWKEVQPTVNVSNTGLPELQGLVTGQIYKLEEIQAPEAHVLLDKPIYFTVVDGKVQLCNADGNPNSGTDDMWSLNTEENVLTIKNNILYSLPSAGGPGIYWYTLSGTLLMAGAALIVYRQKRKREVLLRK